MSNESVTNYCRHVPYSSIKMALNKEPSDRQMNLVNTWDLFVAGSSLSENAELPLQVPIEYDNAEFRVKFKVDNSWFKEDNILLYFEIVAKRTEVVINGTTCGIFSAGYNSLIIKQLIKKGVNEIVFKSEGKISSLPIRLRSVSLVRLPFGGIADLHVFSYFDPYYKDAFLNVRVVLGGQTGNDTETRVVAWRLYDANGEIFASSPLKEVSLMERDITVESEVLVVDPLHWNADTPHLYSLVVIVADKLDRILDVRSLPWGFRNITVIQESKGDRVNLNGKSVKLRGAELLDFDFCAPYPELEEKLNNVKQQNINSILTPSYTTEDFFHITDKLGIYVVGELDSISTLRECSYHSSIMVWLPEEKKDVQSIRKELTQRGSQQLLATTSRFSSSSEILVLKSLSISRIVRILKNKRRRNPVLVNGISNNVETILRLKHWLEEQPKFVGAFVGGLTDWMNDSFQAVYAPVIVTDDKLQEGWISIKNQNDFINLNIFELQWSIQWNGEISAEGLVRQPDIAPRMQKRIRLYRDLSAFPGVKKGYLKITLQLIEALPWAPAGKQFVSCQLPLPEQKSISKQSPSDTNKLLWNWKKKNNDILVANKNAGIRHNFISGTIDVLDVGYGNVLSGSGIYPAHFPNQSGNSEYSSVEYLNYRMSLDKCKLLLSYKFLNGGRFNRIRLEMLSAECGGIDILIKTHPRHRGGSIALLMELNLQYEKFLWNGNDIDNNKYSAVSLHNNIVHTGVQWMEFAGNNDKLRIIGINERFSFKILSESGSANLPETLVVCISSSRHLPAWQIRIQGNMTIKTTGATG